MSIHGLDTFFRATSVTLIGASSTPGTIGEGVLRNLLAGGFRGRVQAVNPKHTEVLGIPCVARVAELGHAPELAVLCTPPASIPTLVSELAARGCRAAVVLSAGLGSASEPGSLAQAMLAAARPSGLRLLGPNCVGWIAPRIGLNASFAPGAALPGRLAFLSQSGALCTAVLEWANARGIGFSAFASLGDMADVDFADCIDWLGSDPETSAILLYVESLGQARKFLSAARGAARNKPLVAIKAGRVPEGAAAAASHTGAMAGSDELFDYAFRRAGILRVAETAELFDAVETLERVGSGFGERLAIVSNGGGPAVLAVDALVAQGVRPAALSPATVQALDAFLPRGWSRANPVDLIGDSRPERYARAVGLLADAPEVDVLLVLHAPTIVAPSSECARAVVEAVRGKRVALFTSWLGGTAAARARELFAQAGVATYETPGAAVRAYAQWLAHRRGRELLQQVPPRAAIAVERETARGLVARALEHGREWLEESELCELLAAYGIAIARSLRAADEQEALARAERLGYPVALKIVSPDILHKSDVGGVALDLADASALRGACRAMRARIAELLPAARIEGFLVQQMLRRPQAHELFVGAARDSVFGPFLMFGAGGIAVEVLHDRALALPPLDRGLARELIGRTRVARLLAGYRGRPPVALEALELCLVRVAQMLVDLPELAELDLNPVLADQEGVVAVDARLRLLPPAARAGLAIAPYPSELEERLRLPNGRVLRLRPIRPEDEPTYRRLCESAGSEDVRFRFFHLVRGLDKSQLARATQIDYDRELALLAQDESDGPIPALGVARAVLSPLGAEAEFSVVVAPEARGIGVGRALVQKLARSLAARGLTRLRGRVLSDDSAMLSLARELGFRLSAASDSAEVEVLLELAPAPHQGPA